MNKNNGKLIATIGIYLYAFFIIYMPRVSDLLIDVPIEIFATALLCLNIMPWLLARNRSGRTLKINKEILRLFAGILAASIYFATRAALGSNELRIPQNTFILVQVMHVLILIDAMTVVGYRREDMMKVLLNLGMLQGVICVLMLIFPRLRNVALSLYYLDREENIFISRMRIYGISGDYTYFTPIYHGMLAGIALLYAVWGDGSYIAYLPFLLIAILLNGRWGLLIFLLSPITATIHLLVKGTISRRLIRYSAISLVMLILGVGVLGVVSPYTYSWIVGGVQDTLDLVFRQEISGNYAALADRMLYFPKGVNLIFGEGHRVYSHHGISRGYNPSDIGYVNDLFMGGLLYVSVLYGTIYGFIFKGGLKREVNDRADSYVNAIVPVFLTTVLLISNYKGECMRGGVVLLGAVFIKLILMQP